jgi:hypothetical protein
LRDQYRPGVFDDESNEIRGRRKHWGWVASTQALLLAPPSGSQGTIVQHLLRAVWLLITAAAGVIFP